MRSILALAFWFSAVIAFSIEPAAAQTRLISVDDVLAIERLDTAVISPEGDLVAAVVLRGAGSGEVFGRTAHEVDPSRGDIWILDRASGDRRNLTRGQTTASGAWCPTWSPDGEHLAFLSTQAEGAEPRGGDNVRLYLWERRSGRIRRLADQGMVTQTRYGSGMHRLDMAGPGAAKLGTCNADEENAPFVWLDRHRLLTLMLPAGHVSGLIDDQARVFHHAEATRRTLAAGRDVQVSASGSGAERTHAGPEWTALLRIVDVRDRKVTGVAPIPAYPFHGSLGIRVSPDGRRAAVLATTGSISPQGDTLWLRNDGDWWVEKRLGFVDLGGPAAIRWVALSPPARLPTTLASWKEDGRTVTFKARADRKDTVASLFSVDAATGRVSVVPDTPNLPTQPRPAGLPADAQLIANDANGLIWSEKSALGTFIRATGKGQTEARDLLALNQHFADLDLGRTVMFDYVGGDGAALKAAVLLPPGYQGDRRLPVITWVYPSAPVPAWSDMSLDPLMPGIYNMRLYAARGYAILLPSMPLGRNGKQELLATLAPAVVPAVDKLVSMGIADARRVGVLGQSFGGYAALGLATQSDRFRAVVAISSLSDLSAFYSGFDAAANGYPGIEHEKSGNPMIAELAQLNAGISPYRDPDFYRRNSPLSFVDRVVAPVLLIHGGHDTRGSSYQAEAFFTGLWRQGKTARILRYWGEDHGLAMSPATVRSVVQEVTDWFDKYMPPSQE